MAAAIRLAIIAAMSLGLPAGNDAFAAVALADGPVARAMRAHPELVGGTGRDVTSSPIGDDRLVGGAPLANHPASHRICEGG